jgi:hypothetical protein
MRVSLFAKGHVRSARTWSLDIARKPGVLHGHGWQHPQEQVASIVIAVLQETPTIQTSGPGVAATYWVVVARSLAIGTIVKLGQRKRRPLACSASSTSSQNLRERVCSGSPKRLGGATRATQPPLGL